jgi:hypothetical protein
MTTPATTLGWESTELYVGGTAWRLADTDAIVQHDQDGWNIYLEHEVYGPEWVDTVETWQDVLDWVNATPSALLGAL